MRCSLLETNTCYDALPMSFKVIVFDQTLLVKKALSALLQYQVPSAPIWNTKEQRFIGMLTGIFLCIVYYSSH